MLEIRYNIDTKEVTGWCGDSKQFGNLKDRGNEAIVVLDIPIPEKSGDAYLYNGITLVPNPDYVEPEPVFDAKAEILKLKEANITLMDRIDKLKVKDKR